MRLPRFSVAAATITCLLVVGGATAFATSAQASAAPKPTGLLSSGDVTAASGYCSWFPGQFGDSSNCDFLDPDVLGPHCNSDAVTKRWGPLKGIFTGTPLGKSVLLRYSPSCRTVWAKIVDVPGPTSDIFGCTITINRNSDGQVIAKTPPFNAVHATIWTAVLYDADVTSYAAAECDFGAEPYEGRTSNY